MCKLCFNITQKQKSECPDLAANISFTDTPTLTEKKQSGNNVLGVSLQEKQQINETFGVIIMLRSVCAGMWRAAVHTVRMRFVLFPASMSNSCLYFYGCIHRSKIVLLKYIYIDFFGHFSLFIHTFTHTSLMLVVTLT